MAILGVIIHDLIALVTGGVIRYLPLKDKWRLSLRGLVLVYSLFFIGQSLLLYVLKEYFTASYLGGQFFQTFTGLLSMIMPFFLIKRSFFQNLFLLAVVSNYHLIVLGTANYAELNWGGAIAASYPYLVSNLTKLALSAVLLPLLIHMLKALFSYWPKEQAVIWKLIWLIPALFACLCIFIGSIFRGTESFTGIPFLLGRVVIAVSCTLTCYFLAWAFRKDSAHAIAVEQSRLEKQQLALQKEQYEKIVQDIEHMREIRHNMHNQLVVLKNYVAAEDYGNANAFLDNLFANMPASMGNRWCKHYAANAVAGYYLSQAEKEGIALDVKLNIPETLGSIEEMDICILLGNLLENALEACRRIDGKRFIKVKGRLQGQYLSVMVQNSFDGIWTEKDGKYLSRKRTESEPARNGIGISSMRAVCHKYDGMLRLEAENSVFKVSALMQL